MKFSYDENDLAIARNIRHFVSSDHVKRVFKHVMSRVVERKRKNREELRCRGDFETRFVKNELETILGIF